MTGNPPASSPAVEARMKRQRQRDTKAETAVRRELHARGLRFRVDSTLEPGLRTRGDIVWKTLRLVVFIDGCYWHGCPVHATRPKANATWWATKLDANIARDSRNNEALAQLGWRVLRFWEHEDPTDTADAIAIEVARRRQGQTRASLATASRRTQ